MNEVYGHARRQVVVILTPELNDGVVSEPTTLAIPLSNTSGWVWLTAASTTASPSPPLRAATLSLEGTRHESTHGADPQHTVTLQGTRSW